MSNSSTSKSSKSRKISGAGLFLVITFTLMLVSTIFIWGISSGWGKVSIERVTIQGNGGKAVSGIIYRPKTATADTPAPVVFDLHGRANTVHICDTWALEQARRGYVVASIDQFGCGDSDYMPQKVDHVENYYLYMKDLDYVLPDQFMYVGFSQGNDAGSSMASKYPETTAGIIQVFNYRMAPSDLPSNMMVIKAQNDQYIGGRYKSREAYESALTEALGLKEPIQEQTMYGSFADKTARKYFFAPGALHQTGGIDKNVIRELLTFMDELYPSPNYIDPSNQIWGMHQFFSLIGAWSFIAFLLALGNFLLTAVPFFKENNVCTPAPANRKTGWQLALNLVIGIGIPAVTFILFSTIGRDYIPTNPILRAQNLNGIVLWLVLNTIITIGIMAFHYLQDKKHGLKLTPADYALAPSGDKKVSLLRVWKSFVLAATIAFIAFSWLAIVEAYTGSGYQFWILSVVHKTTATRFLVGIPYMLCIFFVLFISGIGMNTSRRLADTGNPTKDLLKCMAFNALVAAAPVAILLIIQYSYMLASGVGASALLGLGGNITVGSLNFAFNFPFLMGSMACINTYFHRKTGTVWTGAILGAIVAGLLASGGQPLTM